MAHEHEVDGLPYSGIRVLDLSQGFAGPYCAELLALQGAAVIKVEPPSGDWIREIGAAKDGISAWTVIANAGKRSACIDATRPEGRELLAVLARRCDVLVQNFRPGVIQRLGLAYDKLSSDNPALVFVSVTGFGEEGPDARTAASDSVLQAYSGMAYLNRLPDGTPRRIPFLLPDTVTGIYAAQAVGAALFARARSGRGRHVRLSLLESCAALQASTILDDELSTGRPAAPSTVPSGIFRTRDGFMTVTSMSDAMFTSLLRVVGLDAWAADGRFSNIAARQRNAETINAELARRLAQDNTEHWVSEFTRADVLCAPVLDYQGFRARPQTLEAGIFRSIDQHPFGRLPVVGMPGGDKRWPLGGAPRMGQHTNEILEEAGVAAEERARLAAAGIVIQASSSAGAKSERKR